MAERQTRSLRYWWVGGNDYHDAYFAQSFVGIGEAMGIDRKRFSLLSLN